MEMDVTNDTVEVLPQHKFDIRSLEAYLNQHLPGFGSDPRAVLTVTQYRYHKPGNTQTDDNRTFGTCGLSHRKSGQSNPTFFLQKGSQAYVLRKKPPGSLLPKAHKIDREFKVQKALFSVGFPVPKPLMYCSDACIIGTEFYVMEHVQVSTWTKQYQASAHQDIPAMDQLSKWLMKNLPDNDNEECLIHGDFKLDNIVFHPKECRVIAVLDWELSTFGHPLSDLAHLSLFYFWPRTLPMINGGSYIQENTGIPLMEELISIYCHRRGINPNLPNWNFFMALSFFKLAGIAQGVYSRYLMGNNSSEDSFMTANTVQPLAETGLQLSKRSLSTTIPRRADAESQLFAQSRRGQEVLARVKQFMKQHVFPAEKEVAGYYAQSGNSAEKWGHPLVLEKLKEMAKAEGLWNLFLPAVSGLSQVDYALIAEETGKCFFAPDVFNCQAPDTGNMEVLHLYGSEEQKKQWLEPLLRGDITSVFCMTEPNVSSSDATNIECSIQRDGDGYIVHGKKWWSSGAGNPKCKIAVVLGRTESPSASRHKQHSMILVPMDTPGVELIRPLSVFGYLDNVHGEGRGFEISQGRLGPGRIHHCMRTVGLAERILQIMCDRAAHRVAFKKKLYEHEVVAHWIARSRIIIEEIRLLTLKAAHSIDTLGSASARKEIAMIKVAAPKAVCKIADWAIQVHGGAGVSQDYPLANMYAVIRTLRLADGPDEVHLSAIAKMELQDQARRLTARM
ncbi:Acyl-CoA dehydrogenase family member 11 [Apodemus speciosus]|uniref:Acyl-CoA dehydrogenase family member 11 n=1 Tax=Apodemus speciosus TaxID=105296 RepID=A0ABQ0F5U6_APOSI